MKRIWNDTIVQHNIPHIIKRIKHSHAHKYMNIIHTRTQSIKLSLNRKAASLIDKVQL